MADIELEVAERKLQQYARKSAMDAVAELVWNGLDANATNVTVTLSRSITGAVTELIIVDNGEGMTHERATASFRQYGDTWKDGRRHTNGNRRILHGSKGEGRLFAFTLGRHIRWESVAHTSEGNRLTVVEADAERPKKWTIHEPRDAERGTGTVVTVEVPQDKTLGGVEKPEAHEELLARLAPYLLTYPDVRVEFDGRTLDVEAAIASVEDLSLELPQDYAEDNPPPYVTFVEWKSKRSDLRGLIACTLDGIALTDLKDHHSYSDPVIKFTPYLKSGRFSNSNEDLHMLRMTHAELLDAADRAITEHVAYRRSQVSAEVVQQLKDEGIYPYGDEDGGPALAVERKTFDLVITVAREALPKQAIPRRLSVNLIQTALERDPTDLQRILTSVLALSPEERGDLVRLLDRTDLANVIRAATVVSDRLDFIADMRAIFANPETRADLREIDQLHPAVAANLWLFGEDWPLARTEVGLTSVLQEHLHLLGGDVHMEDRLQSVRRDDGRSGRVDVLMFRSGGTEQRTERLIVELKRPSQVVGKREVDQIKSYARAIVDDPQYRDVGCTWQFCLMTYDYNKKEIERDIRQKDKAPGLADDQDEYQVWVKTWGELFDAAERKLLFFKKQLAIEASGETVTEELDATLARLTAVRTGRTERRSA